MVRDDFELYHLYNCKTKVYPDGTAVATYCNKPKFCMIPKQKRKIEQFSAEYWHSLKYFDLVALFRGWFFDYSVNCIAFDENYAPHFKPVELVHPYICADPETGEMIFRTPDFEKSTKERKEKKQRADNIKRSLDKIYDIVMLNDWDYFFTGTFGDTSFDSTQAKEVLKPLQNWLKNQQKRKGLKYILVPEYQPKSGRIHFHGLLRGDIRVVDSGTRKVEGYDKPLRISTCRNKHIDLEQTQIVYNLPDWKYGHTTATSVYEVSPKIINYMIKYMTKDTSKIFGHFYWASKKGLRRETDMIYEDVDYDSILCPEYPIPNTSDKYKYYTFFPGQNHFHWEEEYNKAEQNTADILAVLNDHDVADNNFIPFEEV